MAEGLREYLDKGDIIIDTSNENWENTQRRQGKLLAQGVYYVVICIHAYQLVDSDLISVSGGYQAARREYA